MTRKHPTRNDFRRFIDRHPPLELDYVKEYIRRRKSKNKRPQIGEMMYVHHREEFDRLYDAFLVQPDLWEECYPDGKWQSTL